MGLFRTVLEIYGNIVRKSQFFFSPRVFIYSIKYLGVRLVSGGNMSFDTISSSRSF